MPDTPLKIQRATEFLLRKEGGVGGEGGDADAVYVGRVLADLGLSEDRAKALALAGIDRNYVTVIYGENSETYAELTALGAFYDSTSGRIFEEKNTNTVLASL